MDNKKNLFFEFPPISKEEWLAKVENDLKGKPMESLHWLLENGIVLEPFYHPQDIPSRDTPLFSGKKNDWEIGEDIIVSDPKKANAELLNCLQKGVNGPRLVLSDSLASDQMEILLNGVNLSFISTHFKTSGTALSVLEAFREVLTKRGEHQQQIKGSVSDDQLSTQNALALLTFTKENLPNFKSLAIEIPDKGYDKTTDSLTAALVAGNAYLSTLSQSGLSLEDISQQIYFSVFIGNSYFVEIAKIRALKILWSNILAAYGIKKPGFPYLDVHLSSKRFEKDANTNLIKSATQAMSAVSGGINRLTILPLDVLNDSSNAPAKRLARNIQHILKMESFFDRVADPAAGSYYVEKLTEKLAESTWKKFQEKVNS